VLSEQEITSSLACLPFVKVQFWDLSTPVPVPSFKTLVLQPLLCLHQDSLNVILPHIMQTKRHQSRLLLSSQSAIARKHFLSHAFLLPMQVLISVDFDTLLF
jgi:hypothetical protein